VLNVASSTRELGLASRAHDVLLCFVRLYLSQQ
jgi:hypothetical protein